MLLPSLTNGKILRRYKRFLADVELEDGHVVTVHCPNTGSMRSCWEPGARVQISHSDNPRRKLPWTLERVDMGGGWIGVHTGRTNPVVGEAIKQKRVDTLTDYHKLRSEVGFETGGLPRTRFDFLLSEGSRADAWVEVKNVTLFEGDCLTFPDAVTERGRKHLEVLAAACHQGYRGIMIYALNRSEGKCFAPAEAIDPRYAATLRRVVGDHGVEVMALRILHQQQSMQIGDRVEVIL